MVKGRRVSPTETRYRLHTAVATGTSPANYNWTYDYDRYGKLQCSGSTGGVDTCPSMTYSASTNRITQIGSQSPTYDLSGDMLTDGTGMGSSTYTWDAENRLATVTYNNKTTTYNYNALGERVSRAGPAFTNGPYYEYYDAFGNLALLINSQYVLEMDFPTVGGKNYVKYQNNTTYYMHTNEIGSTGSITNHAGAFVEREIYNPWGQRWATSGTVYDERFAHIGKERDLESGLDPTPNRMFTSLYGRWVTPDDFHNSKVADPQSWNEYAYAENNPVTLNDPTGQEATVTTKCNEDHSECDVNVTASIAIYSVNGTSQDQLKEAQAALTSQYDQAGTGSFTQDGTTYNVKTDVTITVADSEKAGVDSGAQNVIGIDSSGKTGRSGIAPNTDRGYDKGVFDFSQVMTGGLARHEFTHILGLDDNHGAVLSNSDYAVAHPGMKITPQDLQWALGPELRAGKTNFTVGQREGLNFWGNDRGNRKWWEGYLPR